MYDVLSTLPYRGHTLALTVGGRTDGLIRRHLVGFGRDIGLPTGVVERGIDLVLRATASLDDDQASGALPFNDSITRDLRRQLARRRRDAEA